MFPLSSFAALLIFLPVIVHSVSFLPFLNFTSPSPHIFHSLATLLQTKPQTLFPNGHTIASVTIPRHTLLYHGRHDNNAVPSPEWLALDIEMAYGIMGSMPDSRMLTYRTTKHVKAVYFDGTSASLMGEGTMAQMVLLYNGSDNVPRRGGWGPPPGRGHRGHDKGDKTMDEKEDPPRRPPGHWNPLEDEYFRARGLCKWLNSRGLGGRGWGYEGIVRMNAGFEVIWCDFESPSLKLISNLNVSVPRLEDSGLSEIHRFQRPGRGLVDAQARLRVNDDEGPHGPGMTDPNEPFRDSSSWFWFSAAAKRYVGETRIKVDGYGIFSFYDPELRDQSSARVKQDTERLNLTTEGRWQAQPQDQARNAGLDALTKRRRQHRLQDVRGKDGLFMRLAAEGRLKNALKGAEGVDEVDWQYIAQEIIAQYSNELPELLRLLNADLSGLLNEGTALRNWLRSVRALTHWFLLPFLEYPSKRPYDKQNLKDMFSLESPLAKTALEKCQTQYDTEANDFDDENQMLYNAVRETLAGICSTVVEIGLGIEYHWLLDFNSISSTENGRHAQPNHELLDSSQDWKRKLEELMAWLGWVEKWTSCDKSCGTGEVCYIPMWPVSGFPRRRRPPPEHHDAHQRFIVPQLDWSDSKFLWEPVCVNASSYPPEE